MLNRSTTLKRTGFKSRAQQRSQRDPDRVRSMPTVTPGAFRVPEPVNNAPAARVEKYAPVRSEAYRRLVASLPCVACGIQGHSQAAHANTCKGMGIKASDVDCFPLCADRPGQRGCHSRFDTGTLFSKESRRAHEIKWIAETQATLLRDKLDARQLDLLGINAPQGAECQERTSA